MRCYQKIQCYHLHEIQVYCTILFWLVVKQPLWKIWVRQLGWWHSQLNGWKVGKFMFQTTNRLFLGRIEGSLWQTISVLYLLVAEWTFYESTSGKRTATWETNGITNLKKKHVWVIPLQFTMIPGFGHDGFGHVITQIQPDPGWSFAGSMSTRSTQNPHRGLIAPGPSGPRFS